MLHRNLRAGIIGLTALSASLTLGAQERQSGQGFSFSTGVDLIGVTATVTDRQGRFVPGLRAEDFVITENGTAQTISQFEAERVAVSLGLVLDTSGSMAGEKMSAAQAAVGRFVHDLLGPGDEMFLYRFDNAPVLLQDWTEDRRALVRRLAAVRPDGGTAMYDAVAEAVPLAAQGSRAKKALVLISDGNDTDSVVSLRDVRQLIRESEVLVYAIGIDGAGGGAVRTLPLPIPGRPQIRLPWPGRPAPPRGTSGAATESVNAGALRQITDDSGGRTEIVRAARDLDPATARIADELSQQYFLGYVSTLPKDGRWHTIDVRVRRGDYIVRARKGYIAD
jgi:Ca-activated chloride channel family protein